MDEDKHITMITCAKLRTKLKRLYMLRVFFMKRSLLIYVPRDMKIPTIILQINTSVEKAKLQTEVMPIFSNT